MDVWQVCASVETGGDEGVPEHVPAVAGQCMVCDQRERMQVRGFIMN